MTTPSMLRSPLLWSDGQKLGTLAEVSTNSLPHLHLVDSVLSRCVRRSSCLFGCTHHRMAAAKPSAACAGAPSPPAVGLPPCDSISPALSCQLQKPRCSLCRGTDDQLKFTCRSVQKKQDTLTKIANLFEKAPVLDV